ncbi:uncharacterized protein LOC132548427 [Ylistrum balloti]|uniref:uncharacterized protein LOC132548427 n=1 Tax=Ylistrum balloti TaxID=509963 RepID=UPI002905D563|nr:uncharacterized protein LOC132548427 [Ylistrum balloti]
MDHYRVKISKPEQIHETLMVIFKDEDPLDGNAPRREFYSVFFQCCLFNERMLVGPGRRLVPSNEITVTQNNQLAALGVAIVEAIVNGDCGFPYLNEALYHYIIGDKEYEKYLRMEDIPDHDILYFTQQLMAAETDDGVKSVWCSRSGDCMDGTGWPATRDVKLSNRNELVQHLAKWSVIEKRRTAIDQFKEGLNYRNFLDSLKTNKLLKCLLVFSGEYCVTANYLERMLRPALVQLKVNNKEEDQAKKFFYQLLKEITDENAAYLFFFMTGVLDPPINRLELLVTFNPNKKRTLPEAVACATNLILPLGNSSFEAFEKSFVTAIQYARVGFGNASTY